uniref:Uncharacterized protein n=1 Tax=Arundo donax TaxID=35708 RepID=A0A0A9BU22_ARUDO
MTNQSIRSRNSMIRSFQLSGEARDDQNLLSLR